MGVWLLHLDLPESSYLLPDEFLATEEFKNTLAFDFRLECDLRAGKKTHSYMRFADGGETTSERIIERRCHQLVSDLRRSGRHEMQTVIAHRRYSSAANSRDGYPPV
jgi:hypothetical protein